MAWIARPPQLVGGTVQISFCLPFTTHTHAFCNASQIVLLVLRQPCMGTSQVTYDNTPLYTRRKLAQQPCSISHFALRPPQPHELLSSLVVSPTTLGPTMTPNQLPSCRPSTLRSCKTFLAVLGITVAPYWTTASFPTDMQSTFRSKTFRSSVGGLRIHPLGWN